MFSFLVFSKMMAIVLRQ